MLLCKSTVNNSSSTFNYLNILLAFSYMISRIKAKPYNRNPWYFRLKLDLFLWMDKETRPDIIILFFTWGTTHNRCYNFCCTNPYYLFTTYSGPEGLTRFLHEQSQSSLQPYAIKTPILLMSRVRLATIQ